MMESSSSDDSRHEIKSPEPCEKSDSGLNSSRTRLRLLASLLDEMCSKGKTRRASGLEVVWTLLHVMWFRLRGDQPDVELFYIPLFYLFSSLFQLSCSFSLFPVYRKIVKHLFGLAAPSKHFFPSSVSTIFSMKATHSGN
ncbi:hypothetical protein NPIL_649111 [Nephila pilipes]|uniref:Uncharacterized protein n=1 Tax=Nephila pilipes TaxID=299642 RepID=A0A8X6TMM4_NEPPI|nr:hypothetical protein NPIL_649111 [Nephila pilipes]